VFTEWVDSIIQGQSGQFRAEVMTADDSVPADIRWELDGEGQAAINQSGLVTVPRNDTEGIVYVVRAVAVHNKSSAERSFTVGLIVAPITLSLAPVSFTADRSQENIRFTATLELISIPNTAGNRGVQWTIRNNADSNTRVISTGAGGTGVISNPFCNVNIGFGEPPGRVITLRCTSTFDNSIFAESQITVSNTTVIPLTLTLAPTAVTADRAQENIRFTATLTLLNIPNTAANRTVQWRLSGNSDSNTRIASTNAGGTGVVSNPFCNVNIGSNETPGAVLILRCTSSFDGSIFAESQITVSNVILPPLVIVINAPSNATHDGSFVIVRRNTNYTFTAIVTRNNPSAGTGITWSMTGQTRPQNTSINQSGAANFHNQEPVGTIITIRATSTWDNRIFGEMQVRII
jgi:hypothetical protein